MSAFGFGSLASSTADSYIDGTPFRSERVLGTHALGLHRACQEEMEGRRTPARKWSAAPVFLLLRLKRCLVRLPSGRASAVDQAHRRPSHGV